MNSNVNYQDFSVINSYVKSITDDLEKNITRK